MLDYNSFKSEFVTCCRERLAAGVQAYASGDIIIEEKPVKKAQVGELTGLIFRSSESNCAPTVYVEDFYRSYREGCTVEELSTAAVSNMLHYVRNTPGFSEDAFEDPSNLRVRLLNRSRNNSFLQDVPFMGTGCGLALIAEILSGEFRAVVTNDLLDCLGLSEEELFETALENSSADEPPVLFSLSEMLRGGQEQSRNYLDEGSWEILPAAEPLYFLSNRSCFRGSAVLFYPGMAARLNEILGGAFYILPSSIHELLLLPVHEGDPQKLAAIIRSANRTVVDDADYLSDELYICEAGRIRRTGFSGFAADAEALPS